jgi:hypothetical protein
VLCGAGNKTTYKVVSIRLDIILICLCKFDFYCNFPKISNEQQKRKYNIQPTRPQDHILETNRANSKMKNKLAKTRDSTRDKQPEWEL